MTRPSDHWALSRPDQAQMSLLAFARLQIAQDRPPQRLFTFTRCPRPGRHSLPTSGKRLCVTLPVGRRYNGRLGLALPSR